MYHIYISKIKLFVFVFVFAFIVEPTHQRALSNKRYYKEQLAEKESLRFKRGDDGSEKQYVPETEELKNERTTDEYRKSKEFGNYEAMCRGEDVFVSVLVT